MEIQKPSNIAPAQHRRSDPLEDPWLVIEGRPDIELARKLTAQVKAKVQQRLYSWEDVRNIAAMSASVHGGASLTLSTAELDQLRHLCRIWDIDLKPDRIESHRPVIGPVIVLGKKILSRVVRILLKDMLIQQREFNAAVITLLAKIGSR